MIKICSICLVLMVSGFVGCAKMKYETEVEITEVNIESIEGEEVAQVDLCHELK